MFKNFTIILLFCACKLQAQTFNVAERYGLFNLTFNGVTVINNNYYYCGYGQDSAFPNKVNLYLLKTKSNGEKIFLKSYIDTSGNWLFSMPNGVKKKNEGLIIRAQVEGTGDNNYISLLTADTNGNITKPILFKEDSFLTSFGRDILVKPNSGYYLIGGVQRQDFEVNVQIFKLDNNFQTIWRRFYGINQKREIAYSATQLPNGNIVVGAHRYDAQKVNGTRYQEQTWIFEIDTAGNMVREFLDPDTQTGPAKGITQTPDGGFVYCGRKQTFWNGASTYYYGGTITKLKPDFSEKEWEKIVTDTSSNILGMEQLKKSNKDFYGVGTTVAYTENNDFKRILGGRVIKFDDSGLIKWGKNYVGRDSTDQFYGSFLYDVTLDNDENLICAGQVEQDQGPNLGWILKLDSTGCLTPSNCGYPSLGAQEITQTQKDLTVYPNPFINELFIEFKSNENIQEIAIYNLMGSLVYSETNPSKTLQLSHLPNGLYFLEATIGQGQVFTKKIIKQ